MRSIQSILTPRPARLESADSQGDWPGSGSVSSSGTITASGQKSSRSSTLLETRKSLELLQLYSPKANSRLLESATESLMSRARLSDEGGSPNSPRVLSPEARRRSGRTEKALSPRGAFSDASRMRSPPLGRSHGHGHLSEADFENIMVAWIGVQVHFRTNDRSQCISKSAAAVSALDAASKRIPVRPNSRRGVGVFMTVPPSGRNRPESFEEESIRFLEEQQRRREQRARRRDGGANSDSDTPRAAESRPRQDREMAAWRDVRRDRELGDTTSRAAPQRQQLDRRTRENSESESSRLQTSSRRVPREQNAGLKVGQVYNGTVVKVVSFGAFIALESTSTPDIQGLVHISEIGARFVSNVEDELSVGQQVRVKLISMDRDRISLSIKQARGGPPDGMQDSKYNRVVQLGGDWGDPWGEDPDHPTKWTDFGERPSPFPEFLADDVCIRYTRRLS
ncbi:Polyribonucleotide nucleotidyltransferase [Porphyridium purpureum]|uniref:Polyribonucleotide nucleotidyltransferase n=1 Tax=Porphyridium purpureum TaxID=35688 RepID=A0A5J4YYN8_PORPP|nr:Polyribonucleotide nucleotidyltransferase [Porphyridium purpureum]|eukprot:POR7638..scf209_3